MASNPALPGSVRLRLFHPESVAKFSPSGDCTNRDLDLDIVVGRMSPFPFSDARYDWNRIRGDFSDARGCSSAALWLGSVCPIGVRRINGLRPPIDTLFIDDLQAEFSLALIARFIDDPVHRSLALISVRADDSEGLSWYVGKTVWLLKGCSRGIITAKNADRKDNVALSPGCRHPPYRFSLF